MATRIEASLKKLEDQAVLSTFRYLKESINVRANWEFNETIEI